MKPLRNNRKKLKKEILLLLTELRAKAVYVKTACYECKYSVADSTAGVFGKKLGTCYSLISPFLIKHSFKAASASLDSV
jgi:hypothetical protein